MMPNIVSALNVLQVTVAAERGGAEGVIETIATHLDPSRYRAVLATPRGGDLGLVWRARGWTVLDTPPVSRLVRLDLQYQVARALARAIREHNIAVVHTHGISAHIQGGRAGRMCGVPVVSHSHDTFDATWTRNGLLHRASALTPRAATIAVSEGVKAALLGRVGGTEIEVIPNGVNPHLVAPAPDAPAAPLVVWCGRLQRWKGCHLFLQAARIIRDAHPTARFVVVGGSLFGMDSGYPDEVGRLASALNLDDAVLFTGHVTDARPWLAAASVVVHSATRADPFPLVVLEAMMQGRPVVAFGRGGPAEAIVDGVTGRLVTPDDPGALAAGVIELLAAPATAAEMGDAGRRRALDRYNEDLMVSRIERVYDRVRDANRAPVNRRP
jgi:glycosyltransferase involved in cell wall biosynthesis